MNVVRRLGARDAMWVLGALAAIAAAGGALASCGGSGESSSTTSSSSSSSASSSGGGSGGAGGLGGMGGAGGTVDCPAGTMIAPDPDDLGAFLPLPAVATCSPSGSACGAADTAIHASYRPDFFYPYSQYPEAKIPDPVGGRVQIVTTAAVAGTVTGLDLQGTDAETLLTTAGLDWYHVYPRTLVAGQPVWITFHSRDPVFSSGAVPIALHTSGGDAVSGAFTAAVPLVPVTYATTNEARDQLTVFVKNRDAAPHTVSALKVLGADATAAACIPKKTLAPGEAAIWTVPLCQPLARGAAWTVAVDFADAPTSVGAGRAVTTHFPIEYWPSSHECAYPSSDPATQSRWEQVIGAGFDTMYLQVDWSGCPAPVDRATFIANDLAADDFHVVIETGEPKIYSDDPRVLAVMIADEPDKDYGDPADPTSGPKALAKQAEDFWQNEPGVATFVGGSRHRYAGAYDGVADVAGMDIYAAGCAPHITDIGAYPPLRAPYDYAVAVRENHMPLPTWIYAQAFNGSSNSSSMDRQADPAEARVQAYDVISAGAKGLLYFQLILKEIAVNARNEATWTELGKVNREIRAVRPWLQAGDPMSTAKQLAGGEAIVEAIRSKDAIIVPVIGLSSCVAPTDADCFLNRDVHWLLRDDWLSIEVPIPDDFRLVDAFEIADGTVAPIKGTLAGRTVAIHGIEVGEKQPTRLFVLAADPSVRQQVMAALQ
jgi:hypothetical protein